MRLDAEGLNPFAPIFERVCRSAFQHGIEALEAMGRTVDSLTTLNEILKSDQARRRFIRGVHTGYDQAQSKVGLHIVEWEREIRQINKDVSGAQKSLRKKLRAKIEILSNRQLVLRRIIDGILFSIVGHELAIIRRMAVHDQMHRIDPDVMETTLSEAAKLNRKSRYQFNLACDLTTIAQVGDLLHVDFSLGRKEKWEIIELKKGKVNEKLLSFLNKAGGRLNEETAREIKTEMGLRALKQAERMDRQVFRVEQVKRMEKYDRAFDPRTAQEVRTYSKEIDVDNYGSVLVDIINRGSKNFVAHSIEHCLHFACFPKKQFSEIGGVSAVRHIFFHLMNPKESCAFHKKTDPKRELEQMQQIPPFFDFIELNIRDGFMMPFFTLPLDPKKSRALLMGDIRLFTVMDFSHLIQMGCDAGLPMRWATPKETDSMKKHAPVIPGSPRSRGISIDFPGDDAHTMLAGSLFRVYSEFTTPRSLLKMAKSFPEHRRQMFDQK